GLSVPRFFREERIKGKPKEWEWVDLKLENVFIKPRDNRTHAGGSYLALLKFEQDVQALRAQEGTVAQGLKKSGYRAYWGIGPGLLIGRRRDGRPMEDAMSDGGPQLPPEEFNSFEFARGNASACPFHAHIRKMNPRVDQPFGGADKRTIISAQPVRRGMIY